MKRFSAKTVEEASTIVVLQYEKPASKDSPETQAKRASYGEEIYRKFAKNTIPEVEIEPTPTVPTVTTTNVRMGHARISENNTAYGTAGDTTKKEVCERKWYNKPWDYIAIYPDAGVRERMALAVEAGCANDKIGYSQSGRNRPRAEDDDGGDRKTTCRDGSTLRPEPCWRKVRCSSRTWCGPCGAWCRPAYPRR